MQTCGECEHCTITEAGHALMKLHVGVCDHEERDGNRPLVPQNAKIGELEFLRIPLDCPLPVTEVCKAPAEIPVHPTKRIVVSTDAITVKEPNP